MTDLRFFVAGTPVAQGSMVCRGQLTQTNFHLIVPGNQSKLYPWRDTVAAKARHAAAYKQWQPLDCAELRLVFRFERPKNHYRTGKYADLLHPQAPRYPTTALDVDKCVRAIFDSLEAAGVVTSDAVIVTVTAAKRYCDPDQTPGVNIVLSAPVVAQPTLIEVTT